MFTLSAAVIIHKRVEPGLCPTKFQTLSGSILFITKSIPQLLAFFHAHPCFNAHVYYICLKDQVICSWAPSVVLLCK